MHRRKFIGQTALASAAIMLQNACGTVAPNESVKNIGLQLYSVRDEVPNGIEALLEKVAKMGYNHIETYGYADRKYFGYSIADFAGMLHKTGLNTPSAHVDDPIFLKGESEDSWKIACEDAATLGQEYIVIPWMEEDIRPKNVEEYKTFAARINRAAEIAQGSGLKFAYHNHEFEFVKNGEHSFYDILINETDKDLVLLEMDIFWVHFAGLDPVALMKANPGRFPLWHVKDMNPTTRTNADIGSGEIDFKEIFKHKETSGLDFFFVEQENYDVSPLDSIEKGIEYVKAELV